MKTARKQFRLTDRETQVAALAKQGKSYKKIAAALSLSYSRVGKILMNLRRKIGAENSTETVYILSHYRCE